MQASQPLFAAHEVRTFLPLVVCSPPEKGSKLLICTSHFFVHTFADEIRLYHYANHFIFCGFRFMFYSNDHEPIHVHILKDDCEAKYRVEPEIEQVENHGFKKHELKMIESVIEENREIIIERWNSVFKK